MTDTITLDISLTFAGYNSYGLSFWLEAQNGIASFLAHHSITYGTAFPDPTQNPNNALFNSATRRIGWGSCRKFPIWAAPWQIRQLSPQSRRELIWLPI